KAVIAESFERIHRSNLVGMGVVPFEFTNGDTRKTLELKGDETVTILGLEDVEPRQIVPATIRYASGMTREVDLLCRIDTEVEIEYVENGGVLHYVLRNLAQAA
ncbi:MAG: aconitate hydratase, partial [Pseudomonadota bacterium]